MEYARAHHCHKYIIHEFRTTTLDTHMPTVGVIPTHNMRDHTADDASDATMCSYTPTQITVQHQTSNPDRASAAQKAIHSHDTFPTQVIPSYTPCKGWTSYTIDAPIAQHDTIINHLNSHEAGITAMPEGEFQAAGKHHPSNHYTLITRANAAGTSDALAITNLLALAHTTNNNEFIKYSVGEYI